MEQEGGKGPGKGPAKGVAPAAAEGRLEKAEGKTKLEHSQGME